VTILTTGVALGATQTLPAEEHQLRRRPELDDALAVRLGGRAAEELVFGVASTGGHDDLVAVTVLARHMVREWGMSERLGHITWGAQGPVFLGEDLIHTRDYLDETARVIDEEVTRILDAQAGRAAAELAARRPQLDALAAALLEREMLDAGDVAEVVAHAADSTRSAPRAVQRARGPDGAPREPSAVRSSPRRPVGIGADGRIRGWPTALSRGWPSCAW
jgi:cell division protease FtsH